MRRESIFINKGIFLVNPLVGQMVVQLFLSVIQVKITIKKTNGIKY